MGWAVMSGSPIAELLPVDPLPPQAKQKRLTVAVELIIDKSNSMRDNSKLEFSKEAAREVVRNLKDEDFIGVIGFDSSPFEVVRLLRLERCGHRLLNVSVVYSLPKKPIYFQL